MHAMWGDVADDALDVSTNKRRTPEHSSDAKQSENTYGQAVELTPAIYKEVIDSMMQDDKEVAEEQAVDDVLYSGLFSQ
jgi:hypothetical protein